MGKKDLLYADIMAMNQEVTGSGNFVSVKLPDGNFVSVKLPDGNSIRFVVDFGLFQEKEYSNLNYELQFKPESIDCCFVTHNHIDHIGRLPYMVKKGYKEKIYTTDITCKLLPVAIMNTVKVFKQIAKRKNSQSLYNEVDARKTFQLLRPCTYNETIKIGEYIKVTFFPNGHLPGAAVILVSISYPQYEDINLLFTGDYNCRNMFFNVQPIPKWVLELPLIVVQESTYGNMYSTEIKPCLKENVKKCIEKGGTVVALVFSLGRAQEILYQLKKMQEEGELPSNIPIHLDGKLTQKYTQLYCESKLGLEITDFLPENITFVDDENRINILKDRNPKIIVTSSGMGSYGPAPMYILEYIQQENALIQFTGYTAEGTLGRKLIDAQVGETVQVEGLMVKKKADVQYTKEFSAHAKADEMINFLKQFKKLKLVLLNHGTTDVKEVFAKKILNEVDTKSVGILGGDYLFRVNPYGLVKTLLINENIINPS